MSPIVTPSAKRDEAIASRIQFTTTEGDHITLLKIFRAFKQCKNEREFCQAHYLNLRHMQFASEVRKQLMEMCRRNQIPVRILFLNPTLILQKKINSHLTEKNSAVCLQTFVYILSRFNLVLIIRILLEKLWPRECLLMWPN